MSNELVPTLAELVVGDDEAHLLPILKGVFLHKRFANILHSPFLLASRCQEMTSQLKLVIDLNQEFWKANGSHVFPKPRLELFQFLGRCIVEFLGSIRR